MRTMFEFPLNLPPEQRWRGQLYPAPVVVALIKQETAESPQYLLIRRKGGAYTDQWALVGGKWEFGETMAMAVTREVKEETGLDTAFIASRGLVSERVAPPSQDDIGAHFLIFVCELLALDGEAREQREGAVAWFTLAEIEKLKENEAIIPSDYAMIHAFTRTADPLPHYEAEMIADVGRGQEHPIKLLRFERI